MMISAKTDNGASFGIPVEIGRYKYEQIIGTGAFGVVVRVIERKSGKTFACKVVSRSNLAETGDFESFEQELRILQTIRHPNIVSVYDIVYEADLIYVIMDLCDNGDLLYCLETGKISTMSEIRSIIVQLAKALSYLHGRGIAHRDIKPENILIDSHNSVKLSDFGCCECTYMTRSNASCGTLYYVAPEILDSCVEDPRTTDIWAFGIVLFALCTKKLPWTANTDEELIRQIHEGICMVSITVPRDLVEIIYGCTQISTKTRWTSEDILNVPWIRSFSDNSPQQRGRLRRSETRGTFGRQRRLSLSHPPIVKPILAQSSSLSLSNLGPRISSTNSLTLIY